jgi:hypothetical protein
VNDAPALDTGTPAGRGCPRELVFDPPCGAWSCPACARWHQREWLESFRHRIPGDGSAWVADIAEAKQSTATKAIWRAGGDYFFVLHPTKPGLRIVVANVAFRLRDAAVVKVTRRQARQRFEAALDMCGGTTCRRPAGHSFRWRLVRIERAAELVLLN